MEIDEKTKGEVGIWMQTWYQWVEDGKDNAGSFEDMNDFMLRRIYLYLKGEVTEQVSFFTHIASDKVGMERPDGTTVDNETEWRDLWITVNVDEAFKIQMGRMYVPLTMRPLRSRWDACMCH
jgi:hypothetical protein